MPELLRLLYPRSESAFLLGVSLRTLDYKIQGVEIRVRRVGRKVLIPRDELLKFMRRDHATRPDGSGPGTG
jgi:excisionase family DNA binding protein